MSFKEHQRIVFAAKTLIETLAYRQEEQDENKAKAALMVLKNAYTSNDGAPVYISKGIHQPYTDPHIQLSVTEDDETYLYHLDVSTDNVVQDHSGAKHFHWRPARFSTRIKNDKPSWEPEQYDWAVWPEGAVVSPKSNRNRRNSISGPGLIKLNDEIDEEVARRKVQSDKAKREHEVIGNVSKKLGLTPRNGSETKKLFEGKPAIFTTVKKKEVSCTFDGTYFTHGSQKLKV